MSAAYAPTGCGRFARRCPGPCAQSVPLYLLPVRGRHGESAYPGPFLAYFAAKLSYRKVRKRPPQRTQRLAPKSKSKAAGKLALSEVEGSVRPTHPQSVELDQHNLRRGPQPQGWPPRARPIRNIDQEVTQALQAIN